MAMPLNNNTVLVILASVRSPLTGISKCIPLSLMPKHVKGICICVKECFVYLSLILAIFVVGKKKYPLHSRFNFSQVDELVTGTRGNYECQIRKLVWCWMKFGMCKNTNWLLRMKNYIVDASVVTRQFINNTSWCCIPNINKSVCRASGNFVSIGRPRATKQVLKL